MRVRAMFSLLGVVAVGVSSATSGAAVVVEEQSGCVALDSRWVASSREDQGWVSDTDSYSADIRQHLNLPHLPADSVSIVTDSATCARAALAYGRNLNVPDTTTSRQVFVVRVGPTRYIVVDPNVRNGEFMINMVFDSSFSTVFAIVAH